MRLIAPFRPQFFSTLFSAMWIATESPQLQPSLGTSE
jgi:hypothetical protein